MIFFLSFLLFQTIAGDEFKVEQILLTHSVDETNKATINDAADVACVFNIKLSIENQDEDGCIKRVNDDNKQITLSGTLLSTQIDQEFQNVDVIVELDCFENNCQDGLLGDDCEFDNSCFLGFDDDQRERGTSTLAFSKNQVVELSAELPNYAMKFRLTWTTSGGGVPPSAAPVNGPLPPTFTPTVAVNMIQPTVAPGAVGAPQIGNGATQQATPEPQSDSVVIIAAAGAGLVLVVCLVLVCLISASRSEEKYVDQSSRMSYMQQQQPMQMVTQSFHGMPQQQQMYPSSAMQSGTMQSMHAGMNMQAGMHPTHYRAMPGTMQSTVSNSSMGSVGTMGSFGNQQNYMDMGNGSYRQDVFPVGPSMDNSGNATYSISARGAYSTTEKAAY